MKRVLFVFALSIVFSLKAFSQEEARLLRFPAIHGQQIVFTYAGDLYTVERSGGLARKLTNHPGYEMFARFSPDGKHIAFTGEYDGNREVYLISSGGGVPKRLTYTATLNRDDLSDRMGPNNIVMTWSDNDHIVYRTRAKTFNDFIGHLYKVNINGNLPEELPLPRGGWCSYSPDGKKMAYNRIFREFRTWKYYEGGMADDIWIYDFETKKTENISNNKAQDVFPMWYKNKIYYLSDRGRIMNMYEYDTETKQSKQVTNFDYYDIKFPSLGTDAIIFENGGFIYIFDLNTKKTEKISIVIKDDFIYSRTENVDATKFTGGFDISPDGKRMLMTARGDVFTVPAENGITKNMTNTSNAHDRNAVWSPDGRYIAYISDLSGENEIYIVDKEGEKAAIQLTSAGGAYKYHLKWSPDSKKLLWADKELRLQYIDINNKKITQVDKAEMWEFSDYNWSPDSKWITYARPEIETMSNIYLYNLKDNKKYPVTDGWFNSSSPVFSRDGKYVFFVSSRDFNPVYSWTEWNHAYVNMNRIYFVTLAKDTPSPFEPKNDIVSITNGKKDKVADKKDDKGGDTVIDIDGIQMRIIALPDKPGSYSIVDFIDNRLYYFRSAFGEKAVLKMYEFDKKKETELGDVNSFLVSFDGKKALVRKGSDYHIIDLPKAAIKLDASKVDLSKVIVTVNKKEEWKQIYDEAWRQMRDFFYDPAMHGVDWKAIHEKYAQLVKYVNHRDDLNYLIGEMIGELNVGHAYVGGGDRPKVDKVKMGLLGAVLEQDKSGYVRISKILQGQNWNKDVRSPLTEVGLDVKEGDFIIAVNGRSVLEMNNIYEALIGTAGNTVELSINSKPNTSGSRNILVVPIDDEGELYYFKWVQDNIRKVSEATNGQVGYIHIPDMGVKGLNEFSKYFYPQLSKKALIIDDRGNGGGNVSPMIIERLKREMSRANMARNTQKTATPRQMLHGPKVALINEYSASDGDLFAYQFRRHKLGTLIGKRTWGGVVGIRGTLPFVDGAVLNRPEFATYDEEGWIIEGEGVEPDIYVDNDPAKEYMDIDEQLNKAIEVILEQLKKSPQEIPDIPPFPKKNK